MSRLWKAQEHPDSCFGRRSQEKIKGQSCGLEQTKPLKLWLVGLLPIFGDHGVETCLDGTEVPVAWWNPNIAWV